jgi:UTP--glucose-1-phosphate uridylyltransferase
MINQYNSEDSSIISVQKINKAESVNYGIIDFNNDRAGLIEIEDIIEKPLPINAPSNFGVVGRYIFCNSIFSCLEKTSAGVGNEIQLTDAIKLLLNTKPVFGYEFDGIRFDCGSKLGMIKANIRFAFKNEIYKEELKDFLKKCIKNE